MVFSGDLAQKIVTRAHQYLGQAYDWRTFDCVHFIVSVYRDVGIEIPRFGGIGYPPVDLHLSAEEFARMPLGHSVFFRRKASMANRIWTHAAIIVSPCELVHCSRHFGRVVVISPTTEFLEVYDLAPKT